MAYIVNPKQKEAFTDFGLKLAWAKEVLARQLAVMDYNLKLYDEIADISQLQNSSNLADRDLYNTKIKAYQDLLLAVAGDVALGKMNYADAMKLRSYYTNNIKPIEDARQLRLKVADKMMGEKDSYMTLLGSVADFLANPERGYTAVKGSDLDAAAKNYGTMLAGQSNPNVIGYSPDKQFVYLSQGLDMNNPEHLALLEIGANNILAERGITAENGYSALDIASAKARILQGMLNSSTALVTTLKNAGFETPSLRANTARTWLQYNITKLTNDALRLGRPDLVPGAMPITNEDGTLGVVLGGLYYPRTDAIRDAEGNVTGYSGKPTYSVGANVKTGKGGIAEAAASQGITVNDLGFVEVTHGPHAGRYGSADGKAWYPIKPDGTLDTSQPKMTPSKIKNYQEEDIDYANVTSVVTFKGNRDGSYDNLNNPVNTDGGYSSVNAGEVDLSYYSVEVDWQKIPEELRKALKGEVASTGAVESDIYNKYVILEHPNSWSDSEYIIVPKSTYNAYKEGRSTSTPSETAPASAVTFSNTAGM